MRKSQRPSKSSQGSLTSEELLASIVPTDTVKELILRYGGVQEALLCSTGTELVAFKGIGIVKARQLRYITELAKHLYDTVRPTHIALECPKDVFEFCRDMQFLEVEEVRVLYLNAKNYIVGNEMISRGSLTEATVTPREVFCRAVRMRAASIILVHNHPSSDPEPSNVYMLN